MNWTVACTPGEGDTLETGLYSSGGVKHTGHWLVLSVVKDTLAYALEAGEHALDTDLCFGREVRVAGFEQKKNSQLICTKEKHCKKHGEIEINLIAIS